ncbi:uncharacterized protein LOC115920951 [Strongylocentrotus purpuratus]|uniref:Uncharacterized protein n=1 Tax=Strongylocentrotus purpuratus TaxID=7668 RepID=A0A7M7SV38_STRPU|nr:uncharacterized protein LOC115920951 [Strongylocentrotus purpuratus]
MIIPSFVYTTPDCEWFKMATPNSETDETRISELRREILSYRLTGVSRFGDGSRGASDPDKLDIGLVDLGESGSSVVSALRCALHGAAEHMNYDDDPEVLSSSGEQEVEYLTNSVSVVSRTISCRNNVISKDYLLDILQGLAERVGACLLLVRASLVPYFTSDVITLTTRLTGRSPISIILCDTGKNDIDRLKEYLRGNGIDDIYELPDHNIHHGPNIMPRMSSEKQLELLEMLHRCLVYNEDLATARLTEKLEVVSIR